MEKFLPVLRVSSAKFMFHVYYTRNRPGLHWNVIIKLEYYSSVLALFIHTDNTLIMQLNYLTFKYLFAATRNSRAWLIISCISSFANSGVTA
jgi:hypothetical protein